MVQRAIVTVLALWWFFNAIVMFGCTSVDFTGMTTACFDAAAGTADGGHFTGLSAGLFVLALAAGMLTWMWIVPKVRMVLHNRAQDDEATPASE